MLNEFPYTESRAECDKSDLDQSEQTLHVIELRDVCTESLARGFISQNQDRRIQPYEFEFAQAGTFHLVRSKGVENRGLDSGYFCLELFDENADFLILHVSPRLIWDLTGYWLTAELLEWSINTEDRFFLDMLFDALSPLCEFFGWSLRNIVRAEPLKDFKFEDCLYLLDKDQRRPVVIQADPNQLDSMELQLRQFTVSYHENCLWLGRKVKFNLSIYLDLSKSTWRLQDLTGVDVGDLFDLRQNWPDLDIARVSARAVCSARPDRKWSRRVYVRLDNEDARMEFGNDEWEVKTPENEQFTTGGEGPDSVRLDLHIGSIVLSFNELCNIQEGSLIDIGSSSLPMVQINVGNETILEGELVRLNNQLMVQVIKKVD